MDLRRPLARRTASLITVAALVAASPGTLAQSAVEPSDGPSGGAMVMDAVVARPLGLVLAAVGTATWVVALPFTLPSGSVGKSAQTLVGAPLEETFARCLGCTRPGQQYVPEE